MKGKEADEYVKLNGPQPGQRRFPRRRCCRASPTACRGWWTRYDAKADLTLRARSWLHANCAPCHVEAGGGNAQMELEFQTPLEGMRVMDVKPLHDTLRAAGRAGWSRRAARSGRCC